MIPALLIFFSLFVPIPVTQSSPPSVRDHRVLPGDTWLALSLRYNIPVGELIAHASSINPQRQPTIGSILSISSEENNQGRLLRPLSGGLLQLAAAQHSSPWTLALQNDLQSPYRPLLYTPILIPDGTRFPRELPAGFRTLSLSDNSARSGQALMLQALLEDAPEVDIMLDQNPWLATRNDDHLVALNATGAFFAADQVDLTIQAANSPLWEQPWRFLENEWTYEKIEFASTLATDPEIMRVERERLQEIWSVVSPIPLWTGPFQWPLQDYVEVTSHYGARRSVNGGGYDTYHEGTDFSAYRGTPVLAPAGGLVVVAETLLVRGGAVILDHGLGIHSGYYHLSSLAVQPGQEVEAGQILGEVGSTGRSTGNHLHWDLLIGKTWVDAEAWMASGLSAQIQNAWGAEFPQLEFHDIPDK